MNFYFFQITFDRHVLTIDFGEYKRRRAIRWINKIHERTPVKH